MKKPHVTLCGCKGGVCVYIYRDWVNYVADALNHLSYFNGLTFKCENQMTYKFELIIRY